MTTSTAWEDIAADKRRARDACIPQNWLVSVADDVLDVTGVPHTCGVLTPDELKITETEAPALVKQMLDKKLTSEAVVTAFCKRAAIAQQLVSGSGERNQIERPVAVALVVCYRRLR
jgi:amidase